MKTFLDENFLLQTPVSQQLFFEFARDLPIIDYHSHLNPEYIARDINFKNLTQIWLSGDHYKWRAMRANGIPEQYCTGKSEDYEKFEKWAETVPYTLRNPLYHWTHLELKRYFNVTELLSPVTCRKIYDLCSEMLQRENFSTRNLLRKMKVEILCTTDDPVDSLGNHKQLSKDGFEIKVLPAFRPDMSMEVENAKVYNEYLYKLEKVSNVNISSFHDLINAIRKRHDFFAEMGCRLSDHGIETFYAEDYTESEISTLFKKIRSGNNPTQPEILKFKSAMLVELAIMDFEKEWTQQFHFGAMRNNNSLMMKKIGQNTGYDSIGDFNTGKTMGKFFDRLSSQEELAKTIVYNLNPRDNELVTTMIGNFQDGSIPGKMQFGSGWWFLDQKDGIEKQLNALSNMGLLSRFVGMLTDSRSFLSFPRHEYFRRILCNLIGTDVENGLIPNDSDLIGKLVQDICYYNAKNYFGF
jgi:glucuronate isomerase